jgi:hypothetical protein
MPTMDIFSQNAFSMVSMTAAINKVPYAPDFLGSLGIFEREPVRTTTVGVMIDDSGTLALVPTTPRGAPPIEQKIPARNLRNFTTPRIAIGDTIYAHELQNMPARTDMEAMQNVQAEIAYRLDGPGKLRSKVEATKERMRLGAIQGIVLDADGSTIYNWFTEFGIAAPSAIDFDLDNATPATAIVQQATNIKRLVLRNAKAVTSGPNVRVIGLCGDAFFDALTNHAEVKVTYLNWTAAAELRERAPWTTFRYGGIDWVNYRGTDDNSTIAVATDECKFFPVGIPGLFREVLSPAETFEYANTMGQPIYVMIVRDKDRDMWARVETYSYPLYMCTRPEVLQKAVRT